MQIRKHKIFRQLADSQILQLAVPSIVSNITVPLLGLVDVAITGHMGNAQYLAAIAVGSMIMNIIYWLFAFLRFGTGGMTAQTYGQQRELAHSTGTGDMSECGCMALRSQTICFLMAAAVVILQWPIFLVAMALIAPEAELVPIVHTYYNICIWGAFPSLALYAFTGWFVGMQNTKIPMVISIAQNIINICLSYCFVYVAGMKIEGVALGTLLAQWAGAVMAAAMMWRQYRDVFRGVSLRRALHVDDLQRFFSVNRVIFIRTLFIVAVNLFVVKAGADGGSLMLAVNSLLMQLFILYTYVMDGFAFAAEALCGKYYGAGNKKAFREAVAGIWRWGIALTVVYTLAYAFGGQAFVGILTDDATVRTAAPEYLPWAVAIPFCGIAAFIWDGVFVGITDTRGMMLGTMSGAIAFFIVYYCCRTLLGNHALWLAFNAYLFARGAVQHVIYTRKFSGCLPWKPA